MRLFTLLTFVMITFGISQSYANSAELSEECVSTSEGFYDCIDNFISQALPGNNWCTLLPLGETREEGFILLTLNLESTGQFFSHSTYYFGSSRGSADLGTATGSWELDGNLLLMNYNPLPVGSNTIQLPSQIEVDFQDDEGETLILSYTSEDPSKMFGPILFSKCQP